MYQNNSLSFLFLNTGLLSILHFFVIWSFKKRWRIFGHPVHFTQVTYGSQWKWLILAPTLHICVWCHWGAKANRTDHCVLTSPGLPARVRWPDIGSKEKQTKWLPNHQGDSPDCLCFGFTLPGGILSETYILWPI